jgi:VWFA-related protein
VRRQAPKASGRTATWAVAACVVAAATVLGAQNPPSGQGFSFHTSVDLINVAATVTDENGNFVDGLKEGDFTVYEDGKPQPITQFESERVPVSLGIALDTSGSMFGERIAAAQAALNRFLFDLLGPSDEVFLYRFDSKPELVQRWTSDRAAVSRALGSVHPNGGTAVYDAVAEAIPLAQAGSRKKKALVIISDGNDTSSRIGVEPIHKMIRESEVLVYAIGIDASGSASYPARSNGSSGSSGSSGSASGPSTRAVPQPFPGKGPTSVVAPPSGATSPPSSKPSKPSSRNNGEGVNIDALRALTDDSGGRTEIVVSNRDIDPATARVADELSRQYFIGYSSAAPKDGKWHTIEVVVRKGHYTVRARKGFIAN